MHYILPDNVYKILKWVSVLLLPVVGWVIGELAPDYGMDPYRITHAIDVIGTAIGLLIGASELKAVIGSGNAA